MGGKKPTPEKVESLLQNMEHNLDIIENVWLEKRDYVTGNFLTVADIFAACEIEQTSRFMLSIPLEIYIFLNYRNG